MRKQYYTKLRNLFSGANELRVHRYDDYAYLSEGHVLVSMPYDMYLVQFVEPGKIDFNWCDFPILADGDKFGKKAGTWYEHLGADLASIWSRLYDELFGYEKQFTSVHSVEKGKYTYELNRRMCTRPVRFCETDTDRVMLNQRFYEAMEQSTRGGLVYGCNRSSPVWFFDSDEINASALQGCVLPIMYRDDRVVA